MFEFENCIVLHSTDISTMYGTDRDMYRDYKEAFDYTDEDYGYGVFDDSDVRDYFYDLQREDFDEFYDSIPDNVTAYLVECDFGHWDGRHTETRIVSGLKNLISRILEDEDDFDIFIDKEQRFRINTHNHDASSYYVIHELTDRGLAFIDRQLLNNTDPDFKERVYQLTMDVPVYCNNVADWRS